MKIGVTAASGRLGRAVIEHLKLVHPNDQICAIVRAPEHVEDLGVEVRPGDYGDIDSMRAAFAGVESAVFISAPVSGDTDRMALHANAINAACDSEVRKLIYTSVIGSEKAKGTMFAPFQAINRDTEALLQSAGLEWVIARNALYLDLDLKHIRKANAETGVYRNNAGEGRCGYMSISELAFGLANLVHTDNCTARVLNMVGESHTQSELVEFANHAFGLNVRYEAITLQENIARFMQDELIGARGEAVAHMLSGCFECIEAGAFDVTSDYESAAGRPPKSIPEQIKTL